jgi:serine O-acetyltransferase
VVGIPGRVVRVRPEGGPLEHGRLPDPEGQAIDDLARRVAELEETVQRLAAERADERVDDGLVKLNKARSTD